MGVLEGTSKILMIRPINFGYNVQTAVDNTFQKEPAEDKATVQTKALQEFDTFVERLVSVGIEVMVIDDTPEPATPDSIFPNNWISFHENGTVVLYPMCAQNRRLERKSTVLDTISLLFNIERTIDLTGFEAEGMFLEGTGSMILDRLNDVVYASRSARTHEDVLQNFVSLMGYTRAIMFESSSAGKSIYHTNVMMCLADNFAVVCLDAIFDSEEREDVRRSVEASKKELIEITVAQMNNFAGNMLQVQNSVGEKFLVMSSRAYKSLTEQQIKKLESFNQLIHSDLTTIEDNGGGSARCMMAEIYLQPKLI